MPKAETSAAGRIVNFFQTADLSAAELVLGLAKDAVLARKRALTAVPAAAAPAKTVKAKTAGPAKKRSHHKKKTNAAPSPEDASLPLEAPAEAGDAPVAPA